MKRERVFENTAQLRWIIEGMGRDEKVGSLQKCNDTQNKHEVVCFLSLTFQPMRDVYDVTLRGYFRKRFILIRI